MSLPAKRAKGDLTGLNLYVLNKTFGRSRRVPNRVDATTAPHLRRAIAKGYVEPQGSELVLTDAGYAALVAEEERLSRTPYGMTTWIPMRDPRRARRSVITRRHQTRRSRDASSPGNPNVGSVWEDQLAGDLHEVRETLVQYLDDTWNDTDGMSPTRAAAIFRTQWPTLWRDTGGLRASMFAYSGRGQPPGIRALDRQIMHASRGQLRLYIHDWIVAGRRAGHRRDRARSRMVGLKRRRSRDRRRKPPQVQQEMFRASETVQEIGKPPKQAELFRTPGAVRLTTDPATYLSVSQGRFVVIHHGLPLSPNKASAEEALATARHHKLEVSPYAWDGDDGTFVRRDALRDPRGRRALRRRRYGSGQPRSS